MLDNNINEHARIFDSESCRWYEPDLEVNLMFLKIQEQYCNHKLEIDGLLLLNYVYEILDLPITDPDSRLGWKYNPEDKRQVDFGVWEPRYEFGDYDSGILLNFNANCWIDD